MAKTKKGKELERMFKNQETPEESLRKMSAGIEIFEAKEVNEPEFIAVPFEDIRTKALEYIRSRVIGDWQNAINIKLTKVNAIISWINLCNTSLHCRRRGMIVRAYARDHIRDEWNKVGLLRICPCCGHTQWAA